MKNIIALTVLFVFTLVNAQTVKPLEDMGSNIEEGVYYKDINNVLDAFEGVYEYSGTDFYFKLKLEKKVQRNNSYWWNDVLNGSYQYVVNGVDINYLSDVLSGDAIARVEVDWIRDDFDTYFCSECLHEKWLIGAISDSINNKSAKLQIAKRIVDGVEGLQIGLYLTIHRKYSWETDNQIQLPIGQFFVRKIN